MSKPPNSLMIFALLILSLISVWIAPVFLGMDIPVMAFTETDADPFEFEEDLFLVSRGAEGMTHEISFRIGEMPLNRQPASLSRVFSPPRSVSS